MKVLQLCPYAIARPGGVQRHVLDLTDWLCAQGHETRIIAPPGPQTISGPPERVTEIGRARSISLHGTAFEVSFAAPWSVRRLASELQDWGVDLIHIHTPWTPFLVWQIWRKLNLPTVATVHATLPAADSRGLSDRYIRIAARHFMRHCQAITAPSDAPVELLKSLHPRIDVTVLPPAIDLSGWRAAAAPSRQGEAIQMVFLGRLEDRKGVAVLLDAWQKVAPRNSNLHLMIAGDGAMRDLVESAVRADATGRLAFAGRPDNAAAKSLVASADLFLAPAPYGESFGIVLAEAMAAGAVPIAAANPGYASVMTGPGADLLVEPGDPDALARKIEQLAESKARIQHYRDWGQTHARQFDIARVGPDYLDLYRTLV